MIIRSGNQRTDMLTVWNTFGAAGGTDADVFVHLGQPRGMAYWNRAIELLDAGYIADTGKTKLTGLTGHERRLLEITPLGVTATGLALAGSSHTVKIPRPYTSRELLTQLSSAVEELLQSAVFDGHSRVFTPGIHPPGTPCRMCSVLEVMDRL